MRRSREDSILEVEVGAVAVRIPQPGLRTRSRYRFGIKYQSARARPHKARPTLRREPEYICRQHLIGIVHHSNRPAVQAVRLDVVRVAVAQLDATVFIQEKTTAAQKTVLDGSTLLRSVGVCVFGEGHRRLDADVSLGHLISQAERRK